MTQTPIITSWLRGEFSPKMFGRTDLEAYAHGAAKIENWLIIPQGGLTKRPGSVYLGDAAANSGCRLIPWVVHDGLAYVLECTNNLITIWKVTSTTISKLGSPAATTYTAAQLHEIQFAQDNTGVYLAHQSHPPKKLELTGTDSFTFGNVSFSGNAGDVPFSGGAGDYPRAVAIFAGRLWWGSTILEPQTFWGSKSYDYTNHVKYDTVTYTYNRVTDPSTWADPEVAEYETVEDDRDIITADHAIEITLGSDRNDVIQWMASGRELVIGTTSAEWVVPIDISPLALRAIIQTRYGSAAIQGMLVNDAVLFIQPQRKKLREYFYQDAQSAYQSPDLTFLADHIASGLFRGFDYASDPMSLVYGVLESGDLAVLAYDKQAGAIGWQLWTTDGDYESVAVVPQAGKDLAITAVTREGTTVLEYFTDPFCNTEAEHIHLDATKVSTGGSLTGLTWLAGKTVGVVVDGAVQSGSYAVDGAGAITVPAGTLVYVGLPFTAKAQTLPVAAGANYGSAQTQLKRVTQVRARVYHTSDLKVAFDSFDPDDGESADLGDGWFTGDVVISFDGDHDYQAKVCLISDEPSPVTIIALIPEVAVGRVA